MNTQTANAIDLPPMTQFLSQKMSATATCQMNEPTIMPDQKCHAHFEAPITTPHHLRHLHGTVVRR